MDKKPFKASDEDVMKLYTAVIESTGIMAVSNDPDHNLVRSDTGVTITTPVDGKNKPLAVYISADPETVILNPLTESVVANSANTMFFHTLSSVVAVHMIDIMRKVITLAAASRHVSASDDDIAKATKELNDKKSAKSSNTKTEKSSAGNKISDVLKDLTNILSQTDDDANFKELIKLCMPLVQGKIADIDDTTVVEFKRIRKSFTVKTDILGIHYNNKENYCGFTSFLTKSNCNEKFPGVRSKTFGVLKTIMLRVLGLEDSQELSELNYTPVNDCALQFEGYVTQYVNAIERMSKHMSSSVKKTLNLAKLHDVRGFMKYLPEFHRVAKWCLGTVIPSEESGKDTPTNTTTTTPAPATPAPATAVPFLPPSATNPPLIPINQAVAYQQAQQYQQQQYLPPQQVPQAAYYNAPVQPQVIPCGVPIQGGQYYQQPNQMPMMNQPMANGMYCGQGGMQYMPPQMPMQMCPVPQQGGVIMDPNGKFKQRTNPLERK